MILRCKDTATAHSWFVAIHTNIMALLPQVLAELNAMLGATSTAGGSKEVKHIAWLAEQVGWEAGQGLTGSPFRARMVPPFRMSGMFITQSGLQCLTCRSFVSPPLVFSYLLLIITSTRRIDCHDSHHHNITMKRFLSFLSLMTGDNFHDFRMESANLFCKGLLVPRLLNSATIAAKQS